MYRKTINLCILLTIMIIICTLSGCGGKGGSKTSGSQGNTGSLRLALLIPKYGSNSDNNFQMQTVDPQTQFLELVLNDLKFKEVDLASFGTFEDYGVANKLWKGVFDVPVNAYDKVTVKLLDANHNPLTVGTAEYISVQSGEITTVTIGCLPVNSTPILTQTASSISGSVSAGHMTYYSFYAAKGLEYLVTLSNTSGSPIPYLFDPDSINIEFTSYSGSGFSAAKTGIYYLGVYGDSNASFDLNVQNINLPAAEVDHLVINEINNHYTCAIEICNPTNDFVDLSGWSIIISEEVSGVEHRKTVTIPTGKIIPPRGFFVIIQDNGNIGFDLTGLNYITEDFRIIKYSPGNVSIVLRDNTPTNVDFVKFNDGSSFLAPSGSDWVGQGMVAASKNFARNAPCRDSNASADWEISYTTIGYPNDIETDVNLPIIIW